MLSIALLMAGAASPVFGNFTLKNLATFTGLNGQYPFSDLTLSGTTLYGTTASGGANGDGEVFSVPITGGAPTVLGSFNITDGNAPVGPVIISGNTIYGTTSQGGANGNGINNSGTVYSLPLTGGTPTVVASFNGTDGGDPNGKIVLSGSTIYGSAQQGGTASSGVVFSVPVSGGTPHVLASFNGSTNGNNPNGGVILSGTTLYGTTETGGAGGYGEVFSLPIAGGTPNALASFNHTDGYEPNAGLILSGTTIYGTTESGGPVSQFDGTIFSVPVTGGTPNDLASFNGTSGQPAVPYADLILFGNTLYGTTSSGGVNNPGTVFSEPITGGTPTVLTSFGGNNGRVPRGGVVADASGDLFGTTQEGGVSGDGNVFELVAPEPTSAVFLAIGYMTLLRRTHRIAARG
jgi:uncharacterized repeat protein (TIGR03803 family)